MTARRGRRQEEKAAFRPPAPAGTIGPDVTNEERAAIEALADLIFDAWRERRARRAEAA